MLEEQVNIKLVEKTDINDREISVADFSYNEYPKEGFLKRVAYKAGDAYVFDLDYIDRISSDLEESIVGGDGVDGSIALFRNVYGINSDFSVWYIDSDGKVYGSKGIVEIPIDPEKKANVSEELKEGMGVEGDLKVGDVRGRRSLVLDGSSVTGNQIKNLDELSFFPNITELTLKNLNLENINGLQYSPSLQKIWFDNTKSENYDGLKYGLNVEGLYLINNSVEDDNIKVITDQFDKMTELDTVRIRDNSELTKIPKLETLGGIETLYIEENINLTNIYGLSTVKNKTSLKNLYLNENNLTDVVQGENKDKEYNYLVPEIKEGNIINMSYIDGYANLETLNCGVLGGQIYGGSYENGDGDVIKTKSDLVYSYNRELNYLSGIDGEKLVGVTSLNNLKTLHLENCDILDIQLLEQFDKTGKKLNGIYLLGNENFENRQVNKIAKLLNNSSYTISSKYITQLSSNKESLNYSNMDLTDLSFLDENKVTKNLNLTRCSGINDEQTKYIGKMTQLTVLSLGGCTGITDFSFLENLSNLTYLELWGTKVTNEDIKGLTCKNCLGTLLLYSCGGITDFSIFDDFSKIPQSRSGNQFDFRGWGTTMESNVSWLNNENFKCIYLGYCDLTTMQDAISKANDAFGLHCVTNVDFLGQLENCSDITYLKLSSNGENSTENGFMNSNDSLNLSECKNLSEIYFMRTMIENLDVSGCSNLSKITVFDMERGSRWSLPDFSQNQELTYLNLEKNYLEQNDLIALIDDLRPDYDVSDQEKLISGTPLISELHLERNHFSSLEPFSNLGGKTSDLELYVSENQLITLDGIENLTQLTKLDISNNSGLTTIEPILKLKKVENSKLKEVVMTGCNGLPEDAKAKLEEAGINVVK